MRKQFKYPFFLLFFLLTSTGFSQSKEELQKRKELLQKEIYKTNSLLKTAKKEKVQSVVTLKTLNNKIENRNKIINTIRIEVDLYENSIANLKVQIDSTNNTIEKKQLELKKLKDEYAKMIEKAYHNRSNYNRLSFIFSSSSFYQAFKRIRYLQEYSTFRKKQLEEIAKTEQALAIALEELKSKKAILAYDKNQKSKSSTESTRATRFNLS